MDKDPKAWPRQMLAILFGGGLFIALVAFLITGGEIEPPDWYIGVASTYLIGYGVCREVEKWKMRKE